MRMEGDGCAIGAASVVLYRAVRSRRRKARLIVWLLATAAALIGSDARAQSVGGFDGARFIEQRERFTPTVGDAVDLRFLIAREAAGQAVRIAGTTRESV
jgi:hypothetical protein